jgi:uncharacterized protein (TIGR02611 family)
MEPKSHRSTRLHARRERHLERSRVYRIAFAVAGFAVLLVGLAGLALPVLPGWALIAVGLFMLALEFAWAERLLEGTWDRLDRVRQRARRGVTGD